MLFLTRSIDYQYNSRIDFVLEYITKDEEIKKLSEEYNAKFEELRQLLSVDLFDRLNDLDSINTAISNRQTEISYCLGFSDYVTIRNKAKINHL